MHATGGVSFSGGGVIALLASMCQLQALHEVLPNTTSYAVGSTSGGVAGSLLWANGRFGYPPSWKPSEYDTNAHTKLSEYFHGSTNDSTKDQLVWFAALTRLLDPLREQGLRAASGRATEQSGGRWWEDVLKIATHVYGLEPDALKPPTGTIFTATLLDTSAAPVKRDTDGVVINANTSLLSAEYDPVTGILQAMGTRGRLLSPISLPLFSMTAAATSFWAAPILEEPLVFDVANALLPRLPSQDQFILDGGTLDTLGIYPLLRRGVKRIVAFLDDANDLHATSGNVGFVFGARNKTTDLAMWEGPAFAQVFPMHYWPEVFRNLSDPTLGSASLSAVPVLRNDFLGIQEYELDSLLIIALQYSEAFLSEFDSVDPALRPALAKGWPESLDLLGMSPLDANTLCVYAGWGVTRAASQIRAALEGT